MKRISIIKRIFVIALIFLLSINTFAVAVSDNDGAAFITKGEFDSLKNTFQSQIDTYTTSIDSKINDAISGYLANIAVGPTCKEYWKSIDGASGHEFWFLNHLDPDYVTNSTGYPASYKSAYDFTVTRELRYEYWSNVTYVTTNVSQWNGSNFHSWCMGILTNTACVAKYNINDLGNGSNYANSNTSKIGFMQIDKASGYLLFDYNEAWNTPAYVTGNDVLATNTYDKKTYTKTAKVNEAGSGAAYLYVTYATGQKFLRQIAKQHNLNVKVVAKGHTYKDWGSGKATNAGTLRDCYGSVATREDKTALSIEFTTVPTDINQVLKIGTDEGEDKEDTYTYAELSLNVQSSTSDEDLSYCQMGTGLAEIIVIENKLPLKSGVYDSYTLDASKTKSDRLVEYYDATGLKEGTAELSGIECKFKVPKLEYEKVKMNTFSQETASTSYGKDVRYGNGVPFIGNSTGSKANVNYKLKARNGKAKKAWIGFSNKPFIDGAYDTTSKQYGGYKLVDIGTDQVIVLDTDVGDRTIWVNMYVDTSSGTAEEKADAVSFDECKVQVSA